MQPLSSSLVYVHVFFTIHIDIFSFLLSGKFYGRVDIGRFESKTRKGARRPRKIKDITPEEIKAIKERGDNWKPYWYEDKPLPTSPLSRNPHPVNPWLEEEEQFKKEALEKSNDDAPITGIH